MRAFAFFTLLAAAFVHAEDEVSTVTQVLSPDLTPTCLNSLASVYLEIGTHCGSTAVLPVLFGNSTNSTGIFAAAQYLIANSTLLDGACSTSCSDFVTGATANVSDACGAETELTNSTLTGGVHITAPSLGNAVTYLLDVICVPANNNSASTYCVQDQFIAFNKDFPDKSKVTLDAVWNDPNITCLSCALDEVTQFTNISSLTPQYQSIIYEYTNGSALAVANCSHFTKRDGRSLYARSHRL